MVAFRIVTGANFTTSLVHEAAMALDEGLVVGGRMVLADEVPCVAVLLAMDVHDIKVVEQSYVLLFAQGLPGRSR